MKAPGTLQEQVLQFLITGMSNLLIIPSLWIIKKQGLSLQFNIGLFTMICSFMYHTIDSFSDDCVLLLNEQEWHRLDNIGSILCITELILYVSGLSKNLQQALLSLQIISAMILQEWQPWIVWTAVAPVVVLLGLVILLEVSSCLYCSKYLPLAPIRNKKEVLIGYLGLQVASVCFWKGLKNTNDYLRMWHGMWHLLVCIPSFYLWQIHSSEPYNLRQFFKEMRTTISFKNE